MTSESHYVAKRLSVSLGKHLIFEVSGSSLTQLENPGWRLSHVWPYQYPHQVSKVISL